jgi:DHA3 family tetracycline resistance protein-like MFS transporter
VKLPRIAEPLRHRDFRLLFAGQTLTLFGTFVSQVAWPFQLLQLGGSALELGTLAAIYTASSVSFFLIGGAIADRVPRRTLIVVTELASGIVVGLVAIFGIAGILRIWHLYVATVGFGAATAFSIPALGAIIPELVPQEILVPGNALRGMSRQVGRTAGPVVGGLIVATAGPAAAFAFDALTFFGSALAVFFTAARPLAPRVRASMVAEIGQGLRYVFSVTWLWFTIFGFAIVNAGYIGAFAVGLPLLVTEVMREGPSTFGIITAGTGVGEAIGATLIGQLRIRRSGIAMYVFALGGAASLFLYGLVPNVIGATIASLGIGFSFVCFGVLWESALQRQVPRELLGRVTSVDWFGGSLLGPVAPIGAALVANAYGVPALFIVAGAVVLLFTLTGFLVPSIRQLE